MTDFWPGGSKEPDMPRVKKTMCIIDTGELRPKFSSRIVNCFVKICKQC